MSLPRPIVFGNWKMHGLHAEALALAGALAEGVPRPRGSLAVFPPATMLRDVAARLRTTGIAVGGQDCHQAVKGAFTGSLSAAMLRDAGAALVLVGHSERRHGLGEGDALVQAKAKAASAAGLDAVLCVGETEAQWLAGETLAVLGRQLRASWPENATGEGVIVAYEPVWAVGTGRTPALADIERAHATIRSQLPAKAGGVRVLYGGSVKPENAAEIMAVPGVDGLLVGGASLDARAFLAIYRASGGE